MIDLGMPPKPSTLDVKAHHLSQAQAKWDRLSAADYAGITSVGALITAVADRYSLTYDQAKDDVELWLRDVGERPPAGG